MKPRTLLLLLLPVFAFTAMTGVSGQAAAADPLLSDPFSTAALVAKGAGGSLARPLGQPALPCQPPAPTQALTLAEVVDLALCHNPQTREAWANARYQAAQVGVAQSAYLPSLNLSVSSSRNSGSSTFQGGGDQRYNQTQATLSADYLLYDFGGRAANLENARQLVAALNATQDASLQAVFLAAVQAYYQWFAAQAQVAAANDSERAAGESLKAAIARQQVGTATPADRLQAQTALSQATLTRIRAENDARNAQGNLAFALGLPADQAISLVPPPQIKPDARFERDVAALIDAAKRRRPDLAAAQAQVLAAKAGVASARAAGMPSISLFASHDNSHSSLFDPAQSNTLGVSVSVPLFSGFGSHYRVSAAKAQVLARRAQRDALALQVGLDVWRAYQALQTENQALRAAADLLASASESEQMARGRYRAGVGTIVDLLNAQSALASARGQQVQELYNWRLARVSLAQAMGQLDYAAIEAQGQP